MKKFTIILLTLFYFLQAPAQSTSTILPGVGIINNSDTFFIAKDNFQSVVEKIDTFENKVFYGFGFAMACGEAMVIDSLTKDTTWESASWNYHTATLAWSNSIEIHFEGKDQNNLLVEKIIVTYPHIATSADGLTTGDDYSKIFEIYEKIEGSYNCGEKGFNYCFYSEGLTFKVKPYNEQPNPDMFEKIVGFEIYEIK